MPRDFRTKRQKLSFGNFAYLSEPFAYYHFCHAVTCKILYHPAWGYEQNDAFPSGLFYPSNYSDADFIEQIKRDGDKNQCHQVWWCNNRRYQHLRTLKNSKIGRKGRKTNGKVCLHATFLLLSLQLKIDKVGG